MKIMQFNLQTGGVTEMPEMAAKVSSIIHALEVVNLLNNQCCTFGLVYVVTDYDSPSWQQRVQTHIQEKP